MAKRDIATLTEVEEWERLETDGDPEDYALEGGVDDELEDVYNNPGEPIDL